MLVVGLLVLAAGCGEPEPVPTPTPIERPEVVWSLGPPEGPWEDDPWVTAAREYKYEIGVARNSRNFTDPRLAAVATRPKINSWVELYRSQANEGSGLRVALGPTPFTVMGIEVAADGKKATIDVCTYNGWETDYENGENEPRTNHSGLIVQLDQDGHHRYLGSEILQGDCTDIPITEGRFNPAPIPPPPGTYTPDDIYPHAKK